MTTSQGLRAVLGQRAFHRLSRAYVAECPSRSFTLRNLGRVSKIGCSGIRRCRKQGMRLRARHGAAGMGPHRSVRQRCREGCSAPKICWSLVRLSAGIAALHPVACATVSGGRACGFQVNRASGRARSREQRRSKTETSKYDKAGEPVETGANIPGCPPAQLFRSTTAVSASRSIACSARCVEGGRSGRQSGAPSKNSSASPMNNGRCSKHGSQRGQD